MPTPASTRTTLGSLVAPRDQTPGAPAKLDATAADLAHALHAELIGDPATRVERLGTLDDADAATLTFIRDEENAERFAGADAGVALISRDALDGLAAPPLPGSGRALVVVDDADLAMIQLLGAIEDADPHRATHAPIGVDPTARVHPDAHVNDTASIGPGAVVESGASIGADAVIGPGAVIRYRCVIGERVIVHPGAVIGADGFGFRPAPDGRGLVKIPHVGTVIVEHDAEIGAGTCVDRAKLGVTRIGAGTKVDNLVQIGHNVVIGRACVVCGRAGIAGSVEIGDGVMIGGAAGIGDNLTIGAGASVAAFSAVKDDIPAGDSVVGVPAIPRREWVRMYAASRDMPDAIKKLRKMDA